MTLAEKAPLDVWRTENHVREALERWLEQRHVHLEVAGFTADVQPRAVFGEVLRRSLQLRQSNPLDEVAIGLPDVPRCRSLVAGSEVTLRALRIDAYFVRPDGCVEPSPHNHPAG